MTATWSVTKKRHGCRGDLVQQALARNWPTDSHQPTREDLPEFVHEHRVALTQTPSPIRPLRTIRGVTSLIVGARSFAAITSMATAKAAIHVPVIPIVCIYVGGASNSTAA